MNLYNYFQISCGCHHSALITREGILYVWGRNLDGQLGNGTRKEILKPMPLSSPPSTAAASSVKVNIQLNERKIHF